MITVLCDQHVFHWELLSRYGVQNFKFHNVELLFYFINDKKPYFLVIKLKPSIICTVFSMYDKTLMQVFNILDYSG